jgi:ankyrin repeat protein
MKKNILFFSVALLLFVDVVCSEEKITNPGAVHTDELFSAVEQKNNKQIKKWLTSGKYTAHAVGKYNDSIFFHAVMHGNAKCVKLLIEHGADVNAPARFDYETILYSAIAGIVQNPEDAFKKVKLLLKNDVDVDAKMSYERTALHNCIHIDHEFIVPIMNSLIKYKADVNAQNMAGRTALHNAVQKDYIKEYNIQKVRLLLKHGAKPNLVDNKGDSSFHLAIKWGNFPAVQLLLQYGACANQKDAHDKTPLDLAKLLDGTFPFKKHIVQLFTLLTVPHFIQNGSVIVEQQ